MTCCSFLALLHILGAQKFLPDNSENSVVLYDWSIADVYLSITIRLSLKRLTNYTPYFKKWANPGLFFIYFWSFQTNIITIFTTNKCEKCPSSIRCWELNPWTSERESLPITNRPGFTPKTHLILLLNCISSSSRAVQVIPMSFRWYQPILILRFRNRFATTRPASGTSTVACAAATASATAASASVMTATAVTPAPARWMWTNADRRNRQVCSIH